MPGNIYISDKMQHAIRHVANKVIPCFNIHVLKFISPDIGHRGYWNGSLYRMNFQNVDSKTGSAFVTHSCISIRLPLAFMPIIIIIVIFNL